MDMLTLAGPVVLRALFQVGMLDNADVLEHRERSVHGGDVDGRHPALNSPRNGLRGDVAIGPHHVANDRLSLRGQAASTPPKPRDDLVDTFHDLGPYLTAIALQLRSAGECRLRRR